MLTSLSALAETVCASAAENSDLSDMGPPIVSNASFFVCIVIQATFVGNGVELFLPGEVVKRWVEWEEGGRGGEGGRGREREGEGRLAEFYYGFQYAYCLAYFCIALFYSGIYFFYFLFS